MLWFVRVTKPDGTSFILGEDLLFSNDERTANKIVAMEKQAAACYTGGKDWVIEKVPVPQPEAAT
jgi:hypothetical protein